MILKRASDAVATIVSISNFVFMKRNFTLNDSLLDKSGMAFAEAIDPVSSHLRGDSASRSFRADWG